MQTYFVCYCYWQAEQVAWRNTMIDSELLDSELRIRQLERKIGESDEFQHHSRRPTITITSFQLIKKEND